MAGFLTMPPVRRQRGITLMESLITLAILGVGLAGAAKFQAVALKSSREVKARMEAVSLLQDQANRLQHFATHQQYEQLPSTGRVTHTTAHNAYHLAWSLSPGPATDYKLLRIKVSWPNSSGPYREQAQTLISGFEPARSGWRLK